ncbi:MAG: TonB family protein [Nevskia sp.]|nr:TonB family protein [Nevskia sp.]
MNAVIMSRTIRWDAWQLIEEADRRFRRIFVSVAVPALALVVLTHFFYVSPEPKLPPAFDSSQYVELLPEPEVKKPEPEKKIVEPIKEAPPKPVKPIEQVKPKPIEKPPTVVQVKPEPTAKEVAEKSGLLAMKDALSSLRDQNLASATSDRPLSSSTITSKSGIGSAASADAIAASATANSGGIRNGNGVTSSQDGVGLGSRSTGKVSSPLGSGNGPAKGGPPGPDGGRNASEVQAVFARNQGPFYAIFNRAARDNADIGRGKIVVRLTIAPNGSVVSCTMLSSSYGDAELERKIVERIKLMNFGAKAGPNFTLDYPLNYIPQ